MWMICGILSVLFCIFGWIMLVKEKSKAWLASTASLAFVMLTLLMQYKVVVDWVNQSDWAALQDTVSSMFVILIIYTVIMFLANLFLMILGKQTQNTFL